MLSAYINGWTLKDEIDWCIKHELSYILNEKMNVEPHNM